MSVSVGINQYGTDIFLHF